MPAPEPGLPADVIEALRAGNKIEAIKRLREATGLGLKEAKDAIEALTVAGEASPSPSADAARSRPAPPTVQSDTGTGRMLLYVVLGLALAAAIAWFAGLLPGGHP